MATKDSRLTQVETDKKTALSDIEQMYGKQNANGTWSGGMIGASDTYYDKQIQATKDWEAKQTEIQNAQTDFAIQEINQQKAQAKQDYTKEQSGAYTDWQKQSNAYGANAEQMAAQGMANTGFAESSQVSMYNTYQNRVAMARQSYDRAVLNYNNAITEARLKNNSALAEIAYQSLQKQLELSLAGFQYKNTLILEQAKTKRETEQMYHSQYMDVLGQINTESALAETKRHNEAVEAAQAAQLAEERRQFNILHPQTSVPASVVKTVKGYKGYSAKTTGGKVKGGKTTNNTKANTVKVGGKTVYVGEDDPIESGTTKKNKPPVSGKSVMALGYGPINDKELVKLVDEGKAIPYLDNGVVKFKKAFGG